MSPIPGKRLLPQVIDQIAQDDPERPWASFPKTETLQDGYQDISFYRLANAINRMAGFVSSHIGTSATFRTFAYIGKPDMRYHIVAMAAAKTGKRYVDCFTIHLVAASLTKALQALFSSHMNSLEGHLNLMEKTSCDILFSSTSVRVSDIVAARKMTSITIPELDDLLDPTPVPMVAFTKTFEEAAMDPYLVLHTSGTTGLPKPVPDPKHPMLRRTRMIDKPRIRCLSPFLPFHIIALGSSFAISVFGNTTLVFGFKDRAVSAPDVLQVLDYAHCDCCSLSPAMLEIFARDEQALEKLSRMEYISYGGGTLSDAAGRAISSRVPLWSLFGSTEMMGLVQRRPDREDWAYNHFDPDWNGIEWRPVPTDSAQETSTTAPKTNGHPLAHDSSWQQQQQEQQQIYTATIRRDPSLDLLQGAFIAHPELSTWETDDLFVRHPTKPDLWKSTGRTDDLVRFANGLKFHPLRMEQVIVRECRRRSSSDAASPPLDVTTALVYGEMRAQVLLLIELARTKTDGGTSTSTSTGTDASCRLERKNEESLKSRIAARNSTRQRLRPLPRARGAHTHRLYVRKQTVLPGGGQGHDPALQDVRVVPGGDRALLY